MKSVAGVVIAVAGLLGLVYFKFAIVNPAFTQLPDGKYGESLGPISFVRLPVYGLCLALIVVGIWIICGVRVK